MIRLGCHKILSRSFKSPCVILALAFLAILASTNAQINCAEEFFRVSRTNLDETDCHLFFVCMIGSRVDFFCDEGTIFDPERIECRASYPDTCEYAIDIVPYEKPKKFDFDFLLKH
ncbi:CLUMA_CG006097, isoform A [Clunio marinus]|uniref:CLUMA_CG006097, isoform A n=1 Tax=Clunio marinus TaxID=568069 RepID=A0A1J1HWP3_9DIPT|nr:CLUMA_CG006097, isoform A [Clunio marinus]